MVPILSIVGRSNSGKTTLIEGLVLELVSLGYRIGTIKHHFHGDFEIDQEGKDSWRHAQAGAVTVVLSSPTQLAVIRKMNSEMGVHEITGMLGDVDIVLTEGFKKGPFSKIEVNRAAQDVALLCEPGDDLIAVVTDRDLALWMPSFGLNDYAELADFIEGKFLQR